MPKRVVDFMCVDDFFILNKLCPLAGVWDDYSNNARNALHKNHSKH